MALSTKRSFDALKHEVSQKFAEIRAALVMREKLLLRQIDVIENSHSIGRESSRILKEDTTEDEKEIKFIIEQEEELLSLIRTLGRFQLDNMNLAMQDMFLKNEDYIAPSNDHETMYKCLKNSENSENSVLDDGEQPEAIVVDFSKNKSIIEHNAKHMNKSIINITLQEAKELIRKAKIKRETPIPPLNLEELDDELESSIAEAVSSLGRDSPINTKSSQTCGDEKPTKKSRFKPKITINNCNGTINLRNISSLTINCATEDHVNAEIPIKHVDPGETARETDSSSSLFSKGSKKAEKTKAVPNANINDSAPMMASASVTIETSSTGNSTPTTTSSSNFSSNSSSRSQSKKQKGSIKKSLKGSKSAASGNNSNTTEITSTTAVTTQPTSTSAYPDEIINDDEEHNVVTCDFYNRLLNEIKNSLKEKSKRQVDITNNYVSSCAGTQATVPDSTFDDNSNVSSSSQTTEATSSTVQPAKRLILKNFENLKIILEANSDEDPYHPLQIEQWLAEIISETDLEPMQNTDILEHKHSKTHSENFGD